MNIMSEISNWMNKKFLQWQNNRGRRGTVRDFASYLELSLGYTSQLMNGVRNTMGMKTAYRLAGITGDTSIIQIAGYQLPNGSQLPPALKFALDGAVDEIERTYKTQGVSDLLSAEALEIAKRIMEAHGFKVTL
jgi:hypothetical protein